MTMMRLLVISVSFLRQLKSGNKKKKKKKKEKEDRSRAKSSLLFRAAVCKRRFNTPIEISVGSLMYFGPRYFDLKVTRRSKVNLYFDFDYYKSRRISPKLDKIETEITLLRTFLNIHVTE